MHYSQIRYEVADGIATVALARPDVMNRMTFAMARELIDVLDRVDADDAVKAVVFTGEGRNFCSGADLSAGADTFYETSEAVLTDGSTDYSHESVRDFGGILTLRLFNCLKPLIAALNGAAVGIGSTMPLAMDVRLASKDARFGFVFTRRGIVPECCSAWFLPRIVGISNALEWCMSGRLLSADEALAGGLVKSLHDADDLLPAAYRIAAEIRDNTAPVSVALTRQMLWRGLGWNHPMDAHKVDSWGLFSRARTEDTREGIASFLEKRQAQYAGRVSQDMPDFFPWWDEPAYCGPGKLKKQIS